MKKLLVVAAMIGTLSTPAAAGHAKSFGRSQRQNCCSPAGF